MNKTLRAVMATFAVLSVIAFGACAETATSQSTGAYVDDSAITAKVKTAILEDPALKVMQIEVTTYEKVVQLSGFVDTAQTRTHAATVAGRVNGVASVKNNLAVK